MFVQQLINGVLTSGIYALFSVGFAMIFGVLNVLNMAHATFAMIAAMTVTYLVGVDIVGGLAVPAALAVTLLFALVIERTAIRPGSRAKGDNAIEMPLIATIGASMAIENVAGLIFGHRPAVFPYWLQGYIEAGGLLISRALVISAAVSCVLLALLEWMLGRTNFGRQVRAVAQNRQAALIMGIEADRVILSVVLLSAALSGIAGLLVGMSYGFVSPHMSMPYAIKGLIAMIIGGVGSLRGALLGALLLGVGEALSIMAFGSQMRDTAVFVILMAVLLVRPSGLITVASR